jgi:hypothetical protein
MTPEQALVWNMAIDAASKAHHKGLGAIVALKRKFAVTVEHVGTTTKQEVEVKE